MVPCRPRPIAVAAVLTLLVGACGGSSSSTSSAPPSASSSETGTSISQPSTTLKRAFAGKGDVFFVSPSKNIGCALNETGVRCDIRERTWTPPPRPASCELDFGQGVSITGTSPAVLTCAGDTALVGESVLDYGSVVTRGDFECRSETAAMRCRNVKSGHSFSLSRESFTLG